jgi:hypothetical protein
MVIVFPHYKYILSYHKLQAKAKKQKLPFGPLRVLNLTEPFCTIIVHPEHRPTFTLPYYNARALRSMNLQQFWEYVILPHHSILPHQGLHSLCCMFSINGQSPVLLVSGQVIGSICMDAIGDITCYVLPKNVNVVRTELRRTHRLLTDDLDLHNLQQALVVTAMNLIPFFYSINMDIPNIILGYYREFEYRKNQLYPDLCWNEDSAIGKK